MKMRKCVRNIAEPRQGLVLRRQTVRCGAGDLARRVGNHADARATTTLEGPSAGKSAGAAGGIARATSG
jgi:hypothetical protein